MALTSEDIVRLAREAALGQAPSITTPEALEARERLDAQVAAIRARGRVVELPFEFAGATDDTPAPPQQLPRPRTPRQPRQLRRPRG